MYLGYAISVLVIVIAPIIGIGPIVIRDAKGTNNNILCVTMGPRERVTRLGQSYNAVLAQEIAEYWLRWFVAHILAIPFLLFFQHPAALGALPILTLWTAPFYKDLDLIGRAVEVTVADIDGYLEREAQRLIDGTRGNFKHRELADVVKMISRRLWIAAILTKLIWRK